MAIKSGFFNADSGDRTYNAEDISNFFKGLITNGVYEGVEGALQVVADNTHGVTVKAGRAMIESHYVDNTADLSISFPVKYQNLWYSISAILDRTNRDITIQYRQGQIGASGPLKPVILRSDQYYELVLAYVYVSAGNNIVSQDVIEDTRANTDICGFVTGLIKQVDTSTLFAQYTAAYQAFYESFQAWFETLTSELTVNEYIKCFDKTSAVSGKIATISLNMPDYEYAVTDIVNVYANGYMLIPGMDYTIEAGSPAKVHIDLASQSTMRRIHIRVLKSVIGNPPSDIPQISAETNFDVTFTETE